MVQYAGVYDNPVQSVSLEKQVRNVREHVNLGNKQPVLYIKIFRFLLSTDPKLE